MSLKSKKITKSLKLTKAKLLAFGGLLFSFGVVTSVTTTYAWYNLTQIVASVGNLSLRIDEEMDASLELQLVKNEFRDADKDLSHSDIAPEHLRSTNEEGFEGFGPHDLGIEGIKLNDVSGMFQGDWYGNSSLPLLCSAPRNFAPQNKKNERSRRDTDIYVQNIFYLIAGEDASIYLDGSTKKDDEEHMPLYTFIKPSVEKNTEAAGGNLDKYKELNDVIHTVRVSFLTDEGYYIAKLGQVTGSNSVITANPYKTQDYVTYYSGTLDMDKDGYLDVDNEGNEILYGEYTCEENEINRLPTSNAEVVKPESERTTFNGVSRPDANRITNLDELKEQNKIKKENSVLLRDLMYDSEQPHLQGTPICHVKAGEAKRVVVTIYVEGWDEHMTDAINNASFDISLSFLALFDQ